MNKILLTQPNYNSPAKKMHRWYPFSLGLLYPCINKEFETELFDPNFNNTSDEETIDILKKSKPNIVGITSISTEYMFHLKKMTKLVREALPNCIIIIGGIIPTVDIENAIKDKNADYWVIGEGEFRLPKLLKELEKKNHDFSSMDGIAYYDKDNKPVIRQPTTFITDLDSLPFQDYGNLDFFGYANEHMKYAYGLTPRRHPFAFAMTSRGCPFRCVFCSAWKVSGRQARMRSAENVLKEIDMLYEKGIKEIIFFDDHFFFNRQRAIDIMKGMIKRNYKDLLWKSCNLTIWLLDDELLDLMKQSGCNQIIISIESGNQDVLTSIIKKPLNLEKVKTMVSKAKEKGFEIISNFIIGLPHETRAQIRDTFDYAEALDIDYVTFHIATPLPHTELMDICIKENLLSYDKDSYDENTGFTKCMISTKDFTAREIELFRAYEWDRINFKTQKRKEIIAKINGITLEELEDWRRNTRRNVCLKTS